MKKNLLLLVFAVLALAVSAQKDTRPKTTLKSARDSASYAYGIVLGNSIKRQLSEDLNSEVLIAALGATLKGDSMAFTPEVANKVFGDYNRTMQAKAGEKVRLEGRKFLDENKKRPGVTTTASGLQYEILKKGAGTTSPKETDKVEVHYHGTLINGEVFDSSVDRGQPANFGLNQVIKGWTEGLQYMHEGDKFKFFIPSELAYGDRSAGPKIKPGSTLIFEVELLKIGGN
ncbi:MAG: FKBP-type peptidyl-prolyl cis-trans isomerase [Lewinellaceae bacterium]|nr:FKBP-type peptidyl-prolyl cis-trans isomerase [Lewinellaceae bacterium]